MIDTNDRNNAYDIAQICLHGHVINMESSYYPEHNKRFCSHCGASTITTCQICNTPIRGLYHTNPNYPVYRVINPPIPLFCHECGKPYPWALEILEAAKELADEAPNLSDDEKNQMKQDITDVISNSSRATVATNRLKRIVTKAGEPIKNALIELLSKYASDVTVKLLRGW
jgi:hypothetical protein